MRTRVTYAVWLAGLPEERQGVDGGRPAVEGMRLVRAAQVAELYGVDESTVHRWERAGRMRAARRDPGGAKYWLYDELLTDLTAPPAVEQGGDPLELTTALVHAFRTVREIVVAEGCANVHLVWGALTYAPVAGQLSDDLGTATTIMVFKFLHWTPYSRSFSASL